MAQNGFGVYVGLHVRKDSAAIAAFNREVEQAVANAGKIDIGKALSAASVDALTLGNDIQKQLDRFNFRIRIQRFDADGAIANLRRQIESMIGGINVNATGGGSGGGSGAGNASSEASLTRQRDLLTDIVRLQTQAESLLNKDILGGAGSTGVHLKGVISDLQTLQGQVSTTAEMSESEITTINSSFAELRLKLAQIQEGVVASGESGDAVAQTYTRQLNLLNLIAQKRKQINSILSNNTKLTGTGLDTELQKSLSTLDQLEIKIKSMPYISQSTKDRFTAQINEVRNDITGVQNEMVTTGQVGNTMLTRLINGFKKFGGWMVVTRVLTTIIRLCRQVVTNVKEIDSALGQLRIVTGASELKMQEFINTANSLAQQLGKNVSEVLSLIEVFSRLGYSLDDASELSKYAAILSNVAAVNTDEATTGLTSIIKGYNLQVEDASHVADVLTKVGQEYAVSASEMMEAYEKSGAALSATNTSFEKSAGLIAAANASVQNASTVGTALKTISARIRGKVSASVCSNTYACILLCA